MLSEDHDGRPSRTPPRAVKHALRQEVGYGCPATGCASPYLEFHHFDPTWAEQRHHRAEGMIALCPEHHRKADGGSFTREQLRAMKATPFALSAPVKGTFDWRRQQLIARVGGNFFAGSDVLVGLDGLPVVAQRREDGLLLLSIQMLTVSGEERLLMRDQEWVLKGRPLMFDSPPSGKRIAARYSNGDFLSVEFWDAPTREALAQRYMTSPPEQVEFPSVVVDIAMEIPGTSLVFDANEFRFGSGGHMRNQWSVGNRGGGLKVDFKGELARLNPGTGEPNPD